jgi:hypothetical protein
MKKKRYIHQWLIPTKDNNRRPHLWSYEVFALILLVVACIEMGAFLTATLTGRAMLASVLPATLIDLTNTERVQSLESGLIYSEVLTQAAQAKANDMAEHQYFAHTSPSGVEPWYWFQQAGYAYKHAGENLAIDFTDSDQVVAAWMNSPKHRENILNQSYTQIGIAMAQGQYEGHSTTYVVQFFGTPADPAPIAATTQTKPVTIASTAAVTSTPRVETVRHIVSTVAKKSATPLQPEVTLIPVEIQSAPVVTPKPITPVLVAQPVGQVLGAESIQSRILASPLTFVNNMLYVMGALFVLLLLVAVLPIHAQWIHRFAFANGVSAVAVIAVCIALNTAYASQTQIQTHEQSASAISAVGY